MRNTLAIIVALFSFVSSVSAADFPFVDVPLGSPYYSAVKTLYDNSVVVDDGTHKFRPDEMITRDAFVGFLMGSSCNTCVKPTIEEIAAAQVSPFPDILKENPYYYCIAKATNEKVISGFPLDQNGKVTCEDGTVLSETGFCQNNKITRIVALGTLLQKANLWNDQLNQQYQKNITINDVSTYWHGYAQKAIEVGLIELKSDGKILPDEFISRWAFALMAAKILEFNQCVPSKSENTLWSTVEIIDSDGKSLNEVVFTQNTSFSLRAKTNNSQNSLFLWKAIDRVTWKIVTETGPILESSKLGIWNWFIALRTFDKQSKDKTSQASLSLTLWDGGSWYTGDATLTSQVWDKNDATIASILYPAMRLGVNPESPWANTTVSFTPNAIWEGKLNFIWDFWDGARMTTTVNSWPIPANNAKVDHTYSTPWIYVVHVLMIDATGKSVLSTSSVQVSGNIDSDGDGVEDSLDVCPNIKWDSTSKGCPDFATNLYTAWGFLASNSTKNVWGNSSNTSTNASFSANNPNQNTSIFSSISDTDNDNITDDIDACPTISGNSTNSGCPPVWSFLWKIESNGCAMDQIGSKGWIIIEPICDVCPCPTTVSLWSTLRRCDIIFPAILSTDFLSIYSRGPLYQIP
jgi:PKD domain/S-layer homology domain